LLSFTSVRKIQTGEACSEGCETILYKGEYNVNPPD
jgi:hypothetical protein